MTIYNQNYSIVMQEPLKHFLPQWLETSLWRDAELSECRRKKRESTLAPALTSFSGVPRFQTLLAKRGSKKGHIRPYKNVS